MIFKLSCSNPYKNVFSPLGKQTNQRIDYLIIIVICHSPWMHTENKNIFFLCLPLFLFSLYVYTIQKNVDLENDKSNFGDAVFPSWNILWTVEIRILK